MAPACSESTGMARILGSSCRLVTPFDAAVQSPQGQPPLSQRTLMRQSSAAWSMDESLSSPSDMAGFRIVMFFFLLVVLPEGESEPSRALLALFFCCLQRTAAAVLHVSLAAFLFPIDTSRGGSSTQAG